MLGPTETEDVHNSQIFAERATKAYTSTRRKLNPDARNNLSQEVGKYFHVST